MMERLTQWFGAGSDRVAGLAPEYEEKYTADELIDVLLNELAQYEDTELEPQRVAELAKAERDGRLVMLPCKVGDIVWLTRCMGVNAETPIKAKCVAVKWYSFDGTFLYTATTCGGWDRRFTSQDIGKTVFFTREEAEAALEAQKGEVHETDLV